ncbi:hypothetical protein [Thermophagus xiamenensis]|uniref:Uncharacterized protein n=1 Tax=Thermophagus xiamenensis TaxID=385682 RepID=A0A1I1X5K9_9BACT|nr:hypothetical protein [Thermophagus xiamenensis]SFE00963.1 hypothetical protein SAMN05444380_10599 [Thermophagus xiamenensis]
MKSIKTLIVTLIFLTGIQKVNADSINSNSSIQLTETVLLQDMEYKDFISKQNLDTLTIKVADKVELESGKRDYINLIFPILTLILGFFLNRGYDYFSQKEKIKKDGQRWITELRCLEQPLQDQKQSIEDFLKEQAIDKFDTPELKINEILNCEIFKSLDKTNLLKYLDAKNKDFYKAVEFSNSVHGFISSLQYISKTIKSRFNEYIENSSKHFDLFNEYLQQLMQNIVQYGLKIEQTTGKNPFEDLTYKQIWVLVEKFILPHSEDGNIEVFSFQKNFIVPLNDLISKNRLNDDLREMSVITSKCNMEIKALRMEKRYLKDNFIKIISYLDKSKQNLDKLIEKIE